MADPGGARQGAGWSIFLSREIKGLEPTTAALGSTAFANHGRSARRELVGETSGGLTAQAPVARHSVRPNVRSRCE